MNTSFPVPDSAAPAVRRPRRKATTMDGVRLKAFLQKLAAGEDETNAFWAVASDPAIGFSRFRGVTERPSEVVLRRKMASLLARTVPETIGVARDLALAQLAGLSEDALRAVQETVVGDFEDGRAARVRLDAAKSILGSLGISDRPAPVIATQVNVGGLPHGGVPEGA